MARTEPGTLQSAGRRSNRRANQSGPHFFPLISHPLEVPPAIWGILPEDPSRGHTWTAPRFSTKMELYKLTLLQLVVFTEHTTSFLGLPHRARLTESKPFPGALGCGHTARYQPSPKTDSQDVPVFPVTYTPTEESALRLCFPHYSMSRYPQRNRTEGARGALGGKPPSSIRRVRRPGGSYPGARRRGHSRRSGCSVAPPHLGTLSWTQTCSPPSR